MEAQCDLCTRLRVAVDEQKEAERWAKAEQIVTFVAEHGTDGTKARLTEGLFPETDTAGTMCDHVFRSPAEQPRYCKFTRSDVYDAVERAAGWAGQD